MGITTKLMSSLVFVVLFFGTVSTVFAVVTCSHDPVLSRKTIGTEFVAQACIENTSSYRYYDATLIWCDNGIVTLEAAYGDEYTTPGGLIFGYATFRTFGDQYGNHIIAVHPNFGSHPQDIIDGKTISGYDPGQTNAPVLHSGVFDKILYPQSATLDGDNDHYYNCGTADCNDGNAQINSGAAEICNDSLDNDCNLDTDCADSSCSSDPACIGTDPVSEDYPVNGSCLER